MRWFRVLGLVAVWNWTIPARPAAAQGDVADFPEYTPVAGVAGALKSVGSDTMNNLMMLWQEGFRRHYPNVLTQVEGKGSATAPPALRENVANFGPMSRPMKEAEIDDFKRRFGYEPTALPVAVDMLAVYVHRDNPIASLSLRQLDAIYSKSRKAGSAADVRTWGDLGLKGEWADKPISLYGRLPNSGTYGYFKEHVLLGGDFKDSVKEQPGSSTVVDGVASERYALGYSGFGYRRNEVRAVPLTTDEAPEPVPAEALFAYSGEYPLARDLLVYINHRPGGRLDSLRREFIRYIYSREGQRSVIEDGYLPVTPYMAAKTVDPLRLGDVAARLRQAVRENGAAGANPN